MDRFTTVFTSIVLLAFAISATAQPQQRDFSTAFDGYYHQNVMPIVIQGARAALAFSGGHIVANKYSAVESGLAWVTQRQQAAIILPSPAAYLNIHIAGSEQLEGRVQLLDDTGTTIYEYPVSNRHPTKVLLEGLTDISRISFIRDSAAGSFIVTAISYDDEL